MFKDIPDFEGSYQVSDTGQVVRVGSGKGVKAGRTLTLSKHKQGYLVASLWKDNKQKNVLVHRLVASAFIGEIPVAHEINHKNGIKTDNRVENLEIVDRQANIDHAVSTGLIRNKGELNAMSKLTAKQVAEIKARYIPYNRGYKVLAKEYGVSPELIRNIITRGAWSHV